MASEPDRRRGRAPQTAAFADEGQGCGPFRLHALVLVTLNMPREKFWGEILGLSTAGLSVRGIDLNSFEDFARLVRDGEPVAASAVFFPMHRVERIELDVRNGGIPSLGERFVSKSGRELASVLDLAALAERG